MAGSRYFFDGTVYFEGSDGDYWSSTVIGDTSWFLYFDSGNAGMYFSLRANGFSVRCIKD
jgi:hypothetical protein